MKKLLPSLFCALLFTLAVADLPAQPVRRVIFPEMESRLDSVSFYVGMICGFDVAGDIEVIDPHLIAAGILAGFITEGGALTSDLLNVYEEFADEYPEPGRTTTAKQLMRSLAEENPEYLQSNTALRASADEIGDPSGQDVTWYGKTTLLPCILDASERMEFEIPAMENMPDSVWYARGIMEGEFVAEWLDEVEFNHLVEGVKAGYLIGAENFDRSEMEPYLISIFYPGDGDEDYYGYHRSNWRNGIKLPEAILVPEMKSEMDSVSFFFGMYLSGNFQREEVDFSLDMLYRGLIEGLYSGEDLPLDDIEGFLSYFFEERLPEARLEKAMEEVRGQLDSLAALPGVMATESGLLYRIVDPGDMDDRVESHYETIELQYVVREPDGSIYESSDQDGESTTIGYLMDGLAEGLGLIGRGGSIKLYIHPGLAGMEYYSSRDVKGVVYEADLTLLETESSRQAKILAEAQGVLDSLAALPGIRRTESGLLYEIIEPGDLQVRVEDMNESAELVYTIRHLEDGSVYSRSGPDGSVPSLGDMMKGFFEGVTLIGKGGRIHLYVPPGLTDDADGYKREFGSMVFEADITLVDTWKSKEQIELEQARATLDSLAALPGFRRTDSGLLYEILSPGDPEYRVESIYDRASLVYSLRFFESGEIYDESGPEGTIPALGDMMEGFFEGVTLVGKGGRIRLYIPPGLTHDADGYHRSWGSTIFEAEIEVVDAPLATGDEDVIFIQVEEKP